MSELHKQRWLARVQATYCPKGLVNKIEKYEVQALLNASNNFYIFYKKGLIEARIYAHMYDV